MNKIYMFLADGFETVEALAPVDVMRRAGLNVVTVSIMGRREVLSAQDVAVAADTLFEECDFSDADAVVLPGGSVGTENMSAHAPLRAVVNRMNNDGKLIAAICAAPMLIGKHGYLKDLEYACFPGCNDAIIGGKLSDKPVVHVNNIITARSMYYSCDFALEIISVVKGNERAIEIGKQIKGL